MNESPRPTPASIPRSTRDSAIFPYRLTVKNKNRMDRLRDACHLLRSHGIHPDRIHDLQEEYLATSSEKDERSVLGRWFHLEG